MSEKEKELQQTFTWARSQVYNTYNQILGYYQAKSCLEYAHGSNLLDMPCGDGYLTSLLASAFSRVVGVDASTKFLDIARDTLRGSQFQFHEALIEEFQTEERFGTITMLNVLEHVVDPVLALKHAARLLEPKGVLIVHVPNANAINRKLAVLMGTLSHCEELSPFDIQVAGHRRSYCMETLTTDITSAGLKIVSQGGVFYKSLSTPQIDWFLKNGLWDDGGFGWGRMGSENKDWRAEFCRASYELGKQYPLDCNIIYTVCTL